LFEGFKFPNPGKLFEGLNFLPWKPAFGFKISLLFISVGLPGIYLYSKSGFGSFPPDYGITGYILGLPGY